MVRTLKTKFAAPKIDAYTPCFTVDYGNIFASLAHPSTILYMNGIRWQSPGGMFIERMTSYFLVLAL